MHNKIFAIFCLVIGFVIFGLTIAISEGWQPIPSKGTVLDLIPVIPQSTNTVPVLSTINLPEIVITSGETQATGGASSTGGTKASTTNPKPAVNPGAARRRQTNHQAEKSRPLVSPTGLASKAALNYQPLKNNTDHVVRGPVTRANSVPSRGLQRPERETWEFESK